MGWVNPNATHDQHDFSTRQVGWHTLKRANTKKNWVEFNLSFQAI